MSPPKQKDREELFKMLYQKAFARTKVVLSSGEESNYYIDARRVTLSAQGAYLTAKMILESIENDKFSAVGGPTLGADPIVGAISVLSFQIDRPINTFIIRKGPKPHGRQQQIEGPFIPEGSNVILVDDVTTTGKAFVESIEVLKKYNIAVVKAVCLVDREQGAKEALNKYDCPLIALFKAREFLNYRI